MSFMLLNQVQNFEKAMPITESVNAKTITNVSLVHTFAIKKLAAKTQKAVIFVNACKVFVRIMKM